MIGNLAVDQMGDCNAGEGNRLTGWRYAMPRAGVRTVRGPTGYDGISFGDHLVNRVVHVREGGAKAVNIAFDALGMDENLVGDGQITGVPQVIVNAANGSLVVYNGHGVFSFVQNGAGIFGSRGCGAGNAGNKNTLHAQCLGPVQSEFGGLGGGEKYS